MALINDHIISEMENPVMDVFVKKEFQKEYLPEYLAVDFHGSTLQDGKFLMIKVPDCHEVTFIPHTVIASIEVRDEG